MRGEVGERLVLDDPTARQIFLPRLALAPGGERLQTAEHVELSRRYLDSLPCLVGIDTVIGGVGELFHLLVEPVTAPGLDQLVEHHRKNLGEMGDVADGIVDLALVERTTAPVGKARAFIELKADPRLDEVRIADLFGLTQRDRKS